jgi:Cu(I)/Ag(I) efflux system membrane fusion protein
LIKAFILVSRRKEGTSTTLFLFRGREKVAVRKDNMYTFTRLNKMNSEMKKELILTAIVTIGVALAANASSVVGSRDSETLKVKQDTIANVQGSCGMCKTRIEKTAKGVKGVTAAVWEQKTKRLFVTLDPGVTSKEAVAKAVATAGHDAGKEKAEDSVYAALPGCCKYRK